MEDEPPEIHREYVQMLREKGVQAKVSVVED
jgi:hypothetical protein